jgi:hypothetical protein
MRLYTRERKQFVHACNTKAKTMHLKRLKTRERECRTVFEREPQQLSLERVRRAELGERVSPLGNGTFRRGGRRRREDS